MITTDQPTIFPSDVIVKVSSASDGTMLDRIKGTHSFKAVINRREFCKGIDIDYDDVVFQQITYDDTQTYQNLQLVDMTSVSRTNSEVAADCLVTAQSGVGIMLPVADCVATVVYDPATRQLAVVHMGRHSTLTPLLQNTFNQMVDHGANLEDILIWMSPSASKQSYKMSYFEQTKNPDWKPFCVEKPDGIYIDLAGYNRQACLNAGIDPSNIEVSTINTYTSEDYFSHSRGDITMRFAVVAMMR